MLHRDPFIIAPETFHLIQQLQAVPQLQKFYLVGGTALALQLGHRNSIDIDLFTREEYDPQTLVDVLSSLFKVEVSVSKKNVLLSYINNIKADFIRHDYPFVVPPITYDGISFLSKEDIAAMKINAIHRSGKRLKDFIDIYVLLEHFSVEQMIEFFVIKYPQTNPLIALRALHYFEDIDLSIDPPKLRSPLPFEKIRNRINEAILHTSKIF